MKNMLPFKVTIAAVFLTASVFTQRANGQTLVSSELITSLTAGELTLPFVFTAQFDVDYYRITYNTVDVNGEPTVASGGLAVPRGSQCDIFPVAIYCHGTVLRQLDVPSQNNNEAQLPQRFGGIGYITAAPDYLGLGINEGFHPYVHAESQATASIDMYYATIEFIESEENLHYNGETAITGYSQGGHAAMATLKYAQDNGLSEEMGIVAAAPMSGPYNMSGSQAEVLLSDEPYSNPGYVIYLLMSYETAYGTIYNDLGDIIQSPYNETMLTYFDGAQNEYDMDVPNGLLPNLLSEILVDSVLTNMMANDNHPIWTALRDNDNYDWAPQVPIRMYYCSGDEQVPFENSIVARDSMQAKGAVDADAVNVGPGFNHGQCVLPAVLATRTFFNNQTTPCDLTVSTDDFGSSRELKAWPNPTSGPIRFSLPEARGIFAVYDVYGHRVLEQRVNRDEIAADLSGFASGVYIAVFSGEHATQRATIVLE